MPSAAKAFATACAIGQSRAACDGWMSTNTFVTAAKPKAGAPGFSSVNWASRVFQAIRFQPAFAKADVRAVAKTSGSGSPMGPTATSNTVPANGLRLMEIRACCSEVNTRGALNFANSNCALAASASFAEMLCFKAVSLMSAVITIKYVAATPIKSDVSNIQLAQVDTTSAVAKVIPIPKAFLVLEGIWGVFLSAGGAFLYFTVPGRKR